MALVDPNIALSYRAPNIQPQNMMADYAAIQQIQSGQRQGELAQYQLGAAQRAEKTQNVLADAYTQATDPKTGAIDYNKLRTLVAGGGAGAQIPGIEKTRRETETAALTQQEAAFKVQKAKGDFIAQAKRDTSNNPSDANLTAFKEDLTANPLFTTAEKTQLAANVDRILAMPVGERRAFMASQGASASELQPKVSVGPTGIVQTPAYGGAGTIVSGTEAAFGMTPYQKGQLAVSQGQLKVAQDRLAKEGVALDPAETAAVSKAILEGRLDPNKVNGRNARILATTLLSDPNANLLELGVSAAGAAASTKSLATQTAKMSTAANEANQMIGIVRDLSGKVDRTEFPTINAISNAVSKGTGGKEIVQLNTSINALVNSYARAISPTGQPTVSDKNHAREVINSAYSQGQIGAILDVMQQEMGIAREAASTATTELKAAREKERGRPGAAPAGAGALSPAEQSELDQLRKRFGGK